MAGTTLASEMTQGFEKCRATTHTRTMELADCYATVGILQR